MNEFEIIKSFRTLTNNDPAAADFKDDVATFSLAKNQKLIISKDLIVEDIHFLRSNGAKKIAAKLLLSNLSDIASSGAKPIYYMLGFSKNDFVDKKFIKEFTSGLKEIADQFKISLIGGDTVKSNDKLFFSLTIFGVVESKKFLSRQNAKAGDLLFVSENIGDAFLGLEISKNKLKCKDKKFKDYLLNRHFFPTPRIKLGQKLLEDNITKCAADVSDGLLADATNIAKSSNLSVVIDIDKIPISAAAKFILEKNQQIKITDLITAGDDYELVFSCPKSNKSKLLKIAKELKIEVTEIGFFDKKSSHHLKFLHKKKLPTIQKLGYSH